MKLGVDFFIVSLSHFLFLFLFFFVVLKRQLVHGGHRSGWGSSNTSRGSHQHASGEVLSVFDVLDYDTVMECVPSAWNFAPDAPGTVVAPHSAFCIRSLLASFETSSVPVFMTTTTMTTVVVDLLLRVFCLCIYFAQTAKITSAWWTLHQRRAA